MICTVGGQIKLGHLKFNLCKSDHFIVNIFVSVYIICQPIGDKAVIKPCKFVNFDLCDCHFLSQFCLSIDYTYNLIINDKLSCYK
jgi:hypothetical protein